MPGYVSVAGFCHADRYLTGLDARAAVLPVAVVRSIFLGAGQFSDGGHGGTVGLTERSIVPQSAKKKNTEISLWILKSFSFTTRVREKQGYKKSLPFKKNIFVTETRVGTNGPPELDNLGRERAQDDVLFNFYS